MPSNKVYLLGQGADVPVPVEQYLYDSVMVQPEAVEEELIRVGADIAYWNERHAVAHREHLIAKLDSEREEARLSLEHRERLAEDWRVRTGKGEKLREPTVDAVHAAVVLDPDYRESKLREITTEAERARLRGVVSAVEAKKDAVQSIGATRRMEMNGDPLLRSSLAMRRG